jgi:hypothetical protein
VAFVLGVWWQVETFGGLWQMVLVALRNGATQNFKQGG